MGFNIKVFIVILIALFSCGGLALIYFAIEEMTERENRQMALKFARVSMFCQAISLVLLCVIFFLPAKLG